MRDVILYYYKVYTQQLLTHVDNILLRRTGGQYLNTYRGRRVMARGNVN